MYVVVKDFKTATRKFKADPEKEILPAEVENFQMWLDRGFIKGQRVNYNEMNRTDLEALAAERGVDVSSAKSKADVVAALEYAEKAEEAMTSGRLDTLHKPDLERMAAERGLDTSEAKTKADLIALLEAKPVPVGAVGGL